MKNIPNPDDVYPNQYKTSCYIKNVITAPNIFIGEYTYYDDPVDPAGFEKNIFITRAGFPPTTQ